MVKKRLSCLFPEHMIIDKALMQNTFHSRAIHGDERNDFDVMAYQRVLVLSGFSG